MPGPAKRTGAEKSIRVATGSALERLTQDKPFTETVHKMAELFETALAENWGPQPVNVLSFGGHSEDHGDAHREPDEALTEAARVERMKREANTRHFVIGHNDRDQQVVDEEELLRLAADQFPVGLVPIGVDDEADELPVEVDVLADIPHTGGPVQIEFAATRASTGSMEPEDDEDLSYLA